VVAVELRDAEFARLVVAVDDPAAVAPSLPPASRRHDPVGSVRSVTGACTLDPPAGGAEEDGLSDEELTALALAADPDATVDDDAVCLWDVTGQPDGGTLPTWYMPAWRAVRIRSTWRRAVILLVIVAFVAINAYGLCSTYGRVGFG